MITLTLPVPPSVNALYLNRKGGRGRGRIKSPAYRTWIAQADKWLLTQNRTLPKARITGKLKIVFTLPASSRLDSTNALKAPEDYLVSREITGDDKNNWEVTVKKSESVEFLVIEIYPIEEPLT